MMVDKRNPGAQAGAAGVMGPVHATAEGFVIITNRTSKSTQYRITCADEQPFFITVTGRVRWALDTLRNAGCHGITSFENPAPRLAAYIHDLRELGVSIETITEKHEGEFPGTHARYVLRCQVVPVKGGAA